MRTMSKKKPLLKDLPNRNFWALFGILLLLSAVAIITSIDDPFLTGHATAQSISLVKGGSELMFEVKNFGVKNITIQILEEIKKGQIVLEEKDSIPFDGVAYSKFSITSTDAQKIGAIQFEFKIKDEDLRNKALFPQEIKLYANGREIETVKEKKEGLYLYEESSYLYYAARMDRFEEGNYVLGRANKRASAPTSPTGIVTEVAETEPGTPEPAAVEQPLAEPELQQPTVVPRSPWERFTDFWKNLFK